MEAMLILLAILAALVPVLTMQRTETFAGRRVSILLKTLCSLCFLGIAVAAIVMKGQNAIRLWMLVGFLFCLAGDVILQAGDEKWFVAGLASFLMGHVCYISAFVQRSGWHWSMALYILGMSLIYIAVGHKLKVRPKNLLVPVIAYIFTISTMMITAWNGSFYTDSLLLGAGATLFVFSDSVLAYGKFVRSHPLGGALVLGPYYAGQALLAFSLFTVM